METSSKLHTHNDSSFAVTNFAALALGSSVADTIEYCFDVLKLKEFRVSAETITFIRPSDRLFDILNPCHTCAKEFKSALRARNKEACGPFPSDAF